MVATILKYISPAQLKKYGLYAVLSFFMIATVYFVVDDRRERREALQYERREKERLQDILLEQKYLQQEQKELLEETEENLERMDTVKNLSISLANKSNKLKKKRNAK
jgi:hypothetical protein